MSDRVRVAGQERDALGRDVVWTSADGRDGRRWRELTLDAGSGATLRSLTLETDGKGDWIRLEIASSVGILSLHPESNGAVHGNVVAKWGVRHLSLGVVKPARVDVPGSIVCQAALCRSVARQLRVGEGRTVAVARVDDRLEVAVGDITLDRRTTGTWELRDGVGRRLVELDDLGLPVIHVGATRWPLEA